MTIRGFANFAISSSSSKLFRTRSRRYLCESFLGCLVPCHGGPTECIYLFLPPCHRPSPREVWVGFPLLSANTTSRGGCFRGCSDISLCSGLRVGSSPRSFLPLHNVLQGSRDFYIRAERASLPLHAPDMLAVRIQAIDGTRTFTLLDSQPCRPLPSPSTSGTATGTGSGLNETAELRHPRLSHGTTAIVPP